ncbi:MAG: hypothetical protein HOQ45_18480 [Nocardioidaceae bacterium]|nr:hypothetical protein [Nocardioidaceae bacterium]
MIARLRSLAARVWRWLCPPCRIDAAFLEAVALAHEPLPAAERIALIKGAAPGEIDEVFERLMLRLGPPSMWDGGV